MIISDSPAPERVPSSPTIINCVIQNCSSEPDDSFADAGAVTVENGDPVFIGCQFVNNFSFIDAGAVYIFSGSPRFEDCLFMGNVADDDGGAFYDKFGTRTLDEKGDPIPIQLINCMFIGNVSGDNGGAVRAKTQNVEFINCLFQDNIADDDGGAMRLRSPGGDGTPLRMDGCTFDGKPGRG